MAHLCPVLPGDKLEAQVVSAAGSLEDPHAARLQPGLVCHMLQRGEARVMHVQPHPRTQAPAQLLCRGGEGIGWQLSQSGEREREREGEVEGEGEGN